MTWYHSTKHSKPNNTQKPIPTAQRDIFVRNVVTDSDFLSQIMSMFYLHVFSGKFLTSCRQMCVLCLRSRKRRKWRKKPWPPPVLPQWQHHLQSTRPAQGNTVRLSSLLTNYYVSVRCQVWTQLITLKMRGFVVHWPILMKAQYII